MEHWECRFCKALTAEDQVVCWHCGRRKDDPSPVAANRTAAPRLSEQTSDGGSSSKQIGVAVAIIGALMFLFGLVRYNSMASQLVRGFGGKDEVGLWLLFGGGVLAFVGAVVFFNSTGTKPTEARAEPQAAPISGGSQVTPVPVPPTLNPIEQLERLAALKERGVLTESEFEAQKRKLLS